jgi:hypothetical protein
MILASGDAVSKRLLSATINAIAMIAAVICRMMGPPCRIRYRQECERELGERKIVLPPFNQVSVERRQHFEVTVSENVDLADGKHAVRLAPARAELFVHDRFNLLQEKISRP